MIKNSVNPKFLQNLASKASMSEEEVPSVDTEEIEDVKEEIAVPSSQSRGSNHNLDGIRKQVIEIVCDTLSVDESECNDRTAFSDLGADSLDAVELLMKMESHFGITIPDGDARTIRTIGDAVAKVARKKGL